MVTKLTTYRRSKDQIGRDRHRITQLMLKGHERKEIIDLMELENGYRLSDQQLRTDIARIRTSWLTGADINYDILINQETARLDALEKELWDQMRLSAEPSIREIIDQYVREGMDEEDMELIVQKVSTIKQTNPVNPTYFTHIANAQKERRRLLGLYAPTRLGLVVDQQITIKGYEKVSPDDWPSLPEPDVVEGQIVE